MVVLIVRQLVQLIGAPCDRCNVRLTRFDALSAGEKVEILSHFRLREKREPATNAVFVCRPCNMVHDDFSGVQRSMTADSGSICKVCGQPYVRHLGALWATTEVQGFIADNKDLVADVECLRCPRQIKDCALCDAPTQVTGCRHCHTLLAWQPGEGRFRYLTALTDRPLLASVQDRTGGFT